MGKYTSLVPVVSKEITGSRDAREKVKPLQEKPCRDSEGAGKCPPAWRKGSKL